MRDGYRGDSTCTGSGIGIGGSRVSMFGESPFTLGIAGVGEFKELSFFSLSSTTSVAGSGRSFGKGKVTNSIGVAC